MLDTEVSLFTTTNDSYGCALVKWEIKKGVCLESAVAFNDTSYENALVSLCAKLNNRKLKNCNTGSIIKVPSSLRYA